MSESTIEFLKWFIALPGALVAVITLPWLVQRYRLECKKLRLEISALQHDVGQGLFSYRSTGGETPGRVFELYAHYWAIPCYGVLAVGVPLTFAIGTKWIVGIAMALSFIFFISGSVIEERYKFLIGEGRRLNSKP
jgi:hypothetical protein